MSDRWLRPWRKWWRYSPRYKYWALRNWATGYKLGVVCRHRCCDHTTPSHYRWCAVHLAQSATPATPDPEGAQ